MPAISNHPRIAFPPIRIIVGILAVFILLPYGLESGALLGQENSSRQSLIMPYEQHVTSVDEQHSMRMANTQQDIPPGFQPWWSPYVERPLWGSSRALGIDVEALVLGAMKYSPKILALSTIPEIRKTEIVDAQATFDPRAFLESKFIRTSDPVGNILTVGPGSERFRDQNWFSNGGIRRKTDMGGQFEASQRFGFEDNNSIYYIPLPQGTAKLALSYTQPLLNGAGRAYNESVIVLAAIDADVAADQFAAELQNHLLDVNRAYWTLYIERVTLLEKRHLLQEAEKILGELDARKRLDANTGQIVRAQAAVESRRASVIRSEAAIKNAEAKIHLLVSDPHLLVPDRAELIPVQRPHLQYPTVGVRDSLITAMYNRPEINHSLKEIRAACIREKVAAKDLLPVLDAVLATYVSGLEAAGSVGHAWVDQFSVGEPAYTAGLQFELPLGNRSAKSRLCKRQLEIQQFTFQLKQTVAVVVEEIEVAVRDVDAAYCEAQAQYLAMKAANTEINYLEERWRLLPGEDQVAGIVLEDLLSAQERCGISEVNFASAQVGYNLALANLNRATGNLLKCLPVSSSADQAAPAHGGVEELPLPPSEVYPPTPPPPPPPPPTTSLPAAGATATNNTHPQPNGNPNRAAAIVGKSRPEHLPAKHAASPIVATEPSTLPPGRVPAPLPPPTIHVPATAAATTSTNNISVQSKANSNRSAVIVGKSQPNPLATEQGKSPHGDMNTATLPPDGVQAPLPPPLMNGPSTATPTASTKAIIVR